MKTEKLNITIKKQDYKKNLPTRQRGFAICANKNKIVKVLFYYKV